MGSDGYPSCSQVLAIDHDKDLSRDVVADTIRGSTRTSLVSNFAFALQTGDLVHILRQSVTRDGVVAAARIEY